MKQRGSREVRDWGGVNSRHSLTHEVSPHDRCALSGAFFFRAQATRYGLSSIAYDADAVDASQAPILRHSRRPSALTATSRVAGVGVSAAAHMGSCGHVYARYTIPGLAYKPPLSAARGGHDPNDA